LLRAQRADARDVKAVTGVEGHMRHRDGARPIIDEGTKALRVDDFRHRNEAHLDAFPLQIEESVCVVGMIAVDHQDVGPRPQWQRVRRDVHAFGSVFREGNLVSGHAEEASDFGPGLLYSVEPDAFRSGRLEALAKEKLYRRLHRARERRLESRVQIDDPINGREFLPHSVHGVMTRHAPLLLGAPSALGFQPRGAARSWNDGLAATISVRCTISKHPPTTRRIWANRRFRKDIFHISIVFIPKNDNISNRIDSDD